jgi:hypothetical protein
MITWIILGESFSWEHHHSVKSVEQFPPSQSIGSRLRALRPQDQVLNLAKLGASTFDNLTNLVACLQTPYDTTRDIRVIWGWSTQILCLQGWELFPTNGVYWQDRLWTRDYDTTMQKIQQTFVDRFNRRSALHSLVFYHWGGGHAPWVDLESLRGTHHLLYQDLARDTAGSPPTSHHLWPMIRWRDFESSSGRSLPTFSDLFPLTPKKRAKQIEQEYYAWIDYKRANPQMFPDTVHLDWKYYAQLIDKLQEVADLA